MEGNNNNIYGVSSKIIINSSICLNDNMTSRLTTSSVVQAVIICIISFVIIIANVVFIASINSYSYRKYIQHQPRYLLTCLASNDLCIGFVIAFMAIIPALFRCLPFNITWCQLQALLGGVLTRQSSIVLLCIAVDRYTYIAHPDAYERYSNNNKVCMLVICTSLVILISIFGIVVLMKEEYKFNTSGLWACEIFYKRATIRILSACLSYFPTTMLLMYCYGSAYHIFIKRSSSSNHPTPFIQGKIIEDPSRAMVTISLCFVLTATPWTINEIVASCTGYATSYILQFLIHWTTLSSSFWNPFLYWLFNERFKKILSKKLSYKKRLESAIDESNHHISHVMKEEILTNGSVSTCNMHGHATG